MNKTTIIPIAAALMLGTASCSVLGNARPKSDNVADKPLPEAVLPQDRVQIAASKATRSYTPAELREGIIKGDWAIESVGGKKAVAEEPPYIKFADNHRMYGSNGCNTINGYYIYDRTDHSLSFRDVISTMRLCNVEGLTDIEINQALDATRGYRLEASDKDRYCLTLLDAAGEPVMTLMHQDFDFLNGTWRVNAIDGVKIDDPDIQLVIDVQEGHVHGNTGCNVLNGSLDTDMEAANSLSFHGIATTRMACPEPNFQTQLIVALEDASHAQPVTADEALLLDSSGDTVLSLSRVK